MEDFQKTAPNESLVVNGKALVDNKEKDNEFARTYKKFSKTRWAKRIDHSGRKAGID